ncbi:MAG TPA: ATP/GTP-binding protein, partial [Corynebacterium xerosis]
GPGRLAGEDFQVRDVAPGQATKWYRCPGCDQEIPPGVAHVVAWPSDYGGRADDRRHWHRNCWGKRGDRGITRRWG